MSLYTVHMVKKDGCNERQVRFAQEYIVDLHGERAAIRAGYSPNNARVQASRLLTKSNIRELVLARMVDRSEATAIDAAWVLQKLRENVIGGLADKDRSAVNKSLELLGKHLGMFPTQALPGSSPATPQFVAEVGYDINELIKDPEIRGMVLALDAKMRELTGGEGIILEGAVTDVE